MQKTHSPNAKVSLDRQSLMLNLTEAECIALIKKNECFQAEVADGAYIIKIDEYSPIICTAIHNGHRLREELQKTFLLSDAERYYEEDPYTADLISSFPIQLIGNDSRFEYDLNRAKTLSTYFKTAWNKQVWKKTLTPKQRNKSHEKHESFYRVLEAIITQVEKLFKNSIVFDMHSYNHKRIEHKTPTFNIGSSQIDMERWGSVAKHFEQQLNKVELPNIESYAAIDEIFQGRGYLIAHVNAHFDNTLVLPIEVKKVFMDESNGEVYPLVLEDLKAGVKEAISQSAAFFVRKYGKRKTMRKSDMLSSSLPPEVLLLDKKLFALCKNVETLNFINPINIKSERKRFFAKNCNYTPQFKYKQLNINPYIFREKLYQLPVGDVMDADIQQLYRHVIDNLATKIDLLTSIGSDEFMYNSLKYYGEPSETDVANAEFILFAAPLDVKDDELIHDSTYALSYFQEKAKEWELECRVEISTKIIAKAMVNNEKSLLIINKEARFSEKDLESLAYHELGVHMLTTINAKAQALKIFSLGLTGNTHTQEGIAIYSEYCTGNLGLNRLKTLALRVVAVRSMLDDRDFSTTYALLVEKYQVEAEAAFTLTTRVYRGGGLTKDFLYLKGFKEICDLSENGEQKTLNDLLVGKTGLLDASVISEMIERGIIPRPRTIFPFELKKSDGVNILEYLVSSIRS